MAPGFPGFGHRSSTQGDEALSSASALSFASIGWMLLGPQELLTPKNANEMRWDEMNYLNYQQRTGSGVKLWRTGLSIENRDFANQNCFFWNRGFDQQAGLTKIKNLTSIVAGLENLNLPQNAKPNWMILDDTGWLQFPGPQSWAFQSWGVPQAWRSFAKPGRSHPGANDGDGDPCLCS